MPETQTSELIYPYSHVPTPLLDRIKRPVDMQSFSEEELEQLAVEVRQCIIETVSENGGHLAPHLGVVELTIALHYAFDAERDVLIWDVGHQCYAHKLLTGRSDQFHTIRQKGGISGYPNPKESPYDAFIAGHSSISISAGLGMAVAHAKREEDRRTVAIIGDGALTAGIAFEALSHAGHLAKDLLVVLNDNSMSISPSVGALSAYLSRLISGGLYTRAREDISAFVKQVLGPQVTRAAQRVEHSVKGMLTPGAFFEELGFRYFGPVDGHDIEALIHCFKNLRRIHGPVICHCVTKKGKGYPFAERDPLAFHGVKAFDITTGRIISGAPSNPMSRGSFTDAFAEALIEAAEADERVVGVTAAMSTGTGISKLEQRYPDRVFDVGICEQHAVTFSAGLANAGMKPVCAIYSTFLQRSFDQVLHDVCIPGLPVVFAIDRAGAVGEDSPTQQGAYDISFLRAIPGLTLLAPRDDVDLKSMLHWALKQDGPIGIRYARCKANTIGAAKERDVTRGEILRDGTDAVILGLGPCLLACLQTAELLETEGLSIGVADARFIKPLDGELLDRLSHFPILTVEENTLIGGFGSAVLEYFHAKEQIRDINIRSLGFPDRHIPHATREEQLEDMGLSVSGIADAVRRLISASAQVPNEIGR